MTGYNADMAVLSRDSAGLPGGTAIFTVSRQQFMKYPGQCCSRLTKLPHRPVAEKTARLYG
jgi:hypothetical protein